ncbi:acyltransferase family-domain-containing protein [Coniella lustricola]|uniref:Acyltransferase family-domain-containing protein n=1 Tax=Coniella lustricola TaxID=2025994 RepID=A0A2T3AD64_9PEZI|nr:acyltransferase family-domain-containing protein [Coniella lustricola]
MRSPRTGWALRRLRSAVKPRTKPATSTPSLRPTAYLDGLRGFAAFMVYFHHHGLWAHTPDNNLIVENGWGYNGNYYLAAFPGIRLFFNGGHFAVATFFVISGYVLSIKPLTLIQAGEQAKLADNLASQLFRRWLRLYIPLIITTGVYMLTWHTFGGLWIDGAEKQGSMRDEVWWWYAELKNFSFLFNTGGLPWLSYNLHLWSIPVEMKGSITIFTMLLAFSRLTTRARLGGTVVLLFYFVYIADGLYFALFVMGTLLADLDLLATKNELPRLFKALAPYKDFIYYHLLVVALYLGGVPTATKDINDLGKNRGWYYLSLLKPQAAFDYKWFYLFFAATLLVAATPRISWLRRFFETRFCQYLGHISYALYLVHGPLLFTFGDRVYTAVGWIGSNSPGQTEHLAWWMNRFPLPKTGPYGLELAFLLPHIVLIPVNFWCAEAVTRWIDEPAVRFSQWLYRSGLAAPPQLPQQYQQQRQPHLQSSAGGDSSSRPVPTVVIGTEKKSDV